MLITRGYQQGTILLQKQIVPDQNISWLMMSKDNNKLNEYDLNVPFFDILFIKT